MRGSNAALFPSGGADNISPADPSFSYDELPYPSGPHPYSHCDHLAMVARLFGIPAADVRQCRVLEIGCADGANLIPMALTLPGSRFLGIDLSARQIAAGRELVAALGLQNITLLQQNLTELPADGDSFDYIIAHGVYSWTSHPVQQALLELCRTQLAPRGIAFISYNVYPGWQQQTAIRNWLVRATFDADSTVDRMQRVRHLIAELGKSVTTGDKDRSHVSLVQLLARLESWSDGYLRHDLLEEYNEPLYVSEFVERAERHGLQFFAEADVASMAGSGLPVALYRAVERLGGSLAGREQLLDLLTNRALRQSLLCRADCPVGRQIDIQPVRQMYVTSVLRPSAVAARQPLPARFESPGGMVLEIAEPATARALAALHSVWPSGMWFRDLMDPLLGKSDRRQAAQDLAAVLVAGLTERVVTLHTVAPPVATRIEDRPLASPLARLQAQQGSLVTNLRHDLVDLPPAAGWLIGQLDGTRNRAAIDRLVAGHGPPGSPPQDAAALLAHLLRWGLLIDRTQVDRA